MKKALIIVGSLVVLVVVAAFIIPMVIPVDTYKKEILTQVRDATGREARIDGEFALSLLPRAEFVAGKVSLANMKGGTAAQMVTLERMEVRVALLPLLVGKIEVDTFVLDKPVINLEIDKSGRPNWQFKVAAAPAKAVPPKATVPKEAASPKADRSRDKDGVSELGLAGLRLGDVRLVDGQISYTDARTGTSQQIGNINLTISLPSLDSPMKADGIELSCFPGMNRQPRK